jgi:putative membrane protein
MMSGIVAMFTQRPYVVAFLGAFALLAWSERGALRALLWLVTGTALGWLSEFCSVHTGFPFGHYVYHKEQFAAELWIGPVPLFASISFAFMSYFAFSAACRLLAGGSVTARTAIAPTVLVAALIGTWMDTVIDPLTLVGQYWFLGDLYHYEPPGPHFGVPLVNYFGWMVTIGGIVAVNLMLDVRQERRGVPLARGPALPLLPLWGPACCIGVFTFMLAINVWLLLSGAAPDHLPIGSILASGLLSFSAFLAFTVLMLRRRGVSAAASAAPTFAPPSS